MRHQWRVFVIEHLQAKLLADVDAVLLVYDPALRQPGHRLVARLIGDLRALVEKDRRVLLTENLIGALFIVQSAVMRMLPAGGALCATS